MRIATVKIRHRGSGKILIVNEIDWAMGSVPGVSFADWDRIGERRGDGDEAMEAAKAQRELVEKQRPKGAELDAKSKSKQAAVEVAPKASSKKTSRSKKTNKKKAASKKAAK